MSVANPLAASPYATGDLDCSLTNQAGGFPYNQALGFTAQSVMIDNLSPNAWIQEPRSAIFVPPSVIRIIPIPGGTSTARLVLQTPAAVPPIIAPVGTVTAIWFPAQLPPALVALSLLPQQTQIAKLGTGSNAVTPDPIITVPPWTAGLFFAADNSGVRGSPVVGGTTSGTTYTSITIPQGGVAYMTIAPGLDSSYQIQQLSTLGNGHLWIIAVNYTVPSLALP